MAGKMVMEKAASMVRQQVHHLGLMMDKNQAQSMASKLGILMADLWAVWMVSVLVAAMVGLLVANQAELLVGGQGYYSVAGQGRMQVEKKVAVKVCQLVALKVALKVALMAVWTVDRQGERKAGLMAAWMVDLWALYEENLKEVASAFSKVAKLADSKVGWKDTQKETPLVEQLENLKVLSLAHWQECYQEFPWAVKRVHQLAAAMAVAMAMLKKMK